MQMLLIPTAEDKDPDATTPETTYAQSSTPIDATKWGEIQKEIAEATDKEALTGIYNKYKQIYSWEPFKKLLTQKYQSVKK